MHYIGKKREMACLASPTLPNTIKDFLTPLLLGLKGLFTDWGYMEPRLQLSKIRFTLRDFMVSQTGPIAPLLLFLM